MCLHGYSVFALSVDRTLLSKFCVADSFRVVRHVDSSIDVRLVKGEGTMLDGPLRPFVAQCLCTFVPPPPIHMLLNTNDAFEYPVSFRSKSWSLKRNARLCFTYWRRYAHSAQREWDSCWVWVIYFSSLLHYLSCVVLITWCATQCPC